jgi:hypothetical protein
MNAMAPLLRTHNALEAVLADHFDPCWGSPYWLRRRENLNFDPLRDLYSFEDLVAFGPFQEEDLRTYPVSDFVPKKYHARIPDFVYSETGGTTGSPKAVYFSRTEFRLGFIDPFLEVCRHVGWPVGEKWLFLGPSGPHVIGQVLEPICRAMGSPPPLKVDFDPRWALKLTERSTAKARYREHLLDQAVYLLQKEDPRILFGTPQLLERLAARLDEGPRARILGVHYGGTSLSPEQYSYFRNVLFPNAVHLSGYGNSLVGVAFEAGTGEADRLLYYPSSNRHRIRVIPLDDASLSERLAVDVATGETGQIVVSRIDPTFFLPNLVERDRAECVLASGNSTALGWSDQGISNPRPILRTTPSGGALY